MRRDRLNKVIVMKALLLLAFIIVPCALFATEYTTYTTLASGTWTNSTNVWSTDGTTACLCSPGGSVDGDTININHDIELDHNVTVDENCRITIATNASLLSLVYDLIIKDATVIAKGNLTAEKITIQSAGTLDLYAITLTVDTDVDVYGTLIVDFSNFDIINGTVEIYSGGSFELKGGAKLLVASGAFDNRGTTTLCNSCCIQVTTGNVKNWATGTINGDGAVINDGGSIVDLGTWDTNIKWCASADSPTVPSVEDCAGAINTCSFGPLPVELLAFEGEVNEDYIDINWITATEQNCDYYALEKSTDGKTWDRLTIVDGAGTTTNTSYYAYKDFTYSSAINYYRLIQYDFNGDAEMFDIITVQSYRGQRTWMFPNPTDNKFHLVFDQKQKNVDISIYTINGERVYQHPTSDFTEIEIEPNLTPGVYFVHINGLPEVKTLKLVVD